MRRLKKWDRIEYDKEREMVNPFRSFYLTTQELSEIKALPVDDDGEIISSEDSEALLEKILMARGMESLLYPELERQDWSGYVRVWDSGLFWML